MIGKNVGIRRARGQFILATNIDILFSEELMALIAARKLEPGKMYRVDRYDVMAEVPVDASIEERQEYCRTHLLRVNGREGTFPLTADGQRVEPAVDVISTQSVLMSAPESGIYFGPGWLRCGIRPDDRELCCWNWSLGRAPQQAH
jgi:hypothetical protein